MSRLPVIALPFLADSAFTLASMIKQRASNQKEHDPVDAAHHGDEAAK